MVPRKLEASLRQQAEKHAVVLVNGPRKAGKRTLCREVFPHAQSVSPNQVLSGSNLSEVSIIKDVQDFRDGVWWVVENALHRLADRTLILTGVFSPDECRDLQIQFGDRLSVVHLFPFGPGEFRSMKLIVPTDRSDTARPAYRHLDPFEVIWKGRYPDVALGYQSPDQFYQTLVSEYSRAHPGYFRDHRFTDVQRSFLGQIAGMGASCPNISQLARNTGLPRKKVRAGVRELLKAGWIRMIPACSITPYRKRIRSDKVVFMDTGLQCHLLGIRNGHEAATHPLRAHIFSNWVLSSMLKLGYQSDTTVKLTHLSTSTGMSIDGILETDSGVRLISTASGSVFQQEYCSEIRRVRKRILQNTSTGRVDCELVISQKRGLGLSCVRDIEVVPWHRYY